ncbi:hypothetical protein ABZ128_28975 [Streptomyces sp. NPDC006326]|uniref:hypothetical protein n=1 Tax=Streptomyces sp. NPDC006326 TaxID=3156752 RepID=UPI0033A827A8
MSVAPSSATDIGTAQLSRTLYLTASPTAGASAPMSRSIYLAAGYYDWSSTLEGRGQTFAGRHIYLAAGWYSWNCAIQSPANGWYRDTCTLDHGGGPAYLVSDQYKLYVSGSYTFVSFLYGPFTA